MANKQTVELNVPAGVVRQLIIENPEPVILWRVLPGISIALGADGDIIEVSTKERKDRWVVRTTDGETFRGYPVTTGAVESIIAPALAENGFDLLIVNKTEEMEVQS